MLSSLENISAESIIAGLKIAAMFAGVVLASVMVRYLVKLATKKLAKSSSVFLASALQFAVVIAGFYYVALLLGTSPGILLAVVAIFSAGIALAADNTASDMIGGAKLIAFSAFAPGEYVTVDGIHGQVVEIGLFSTRIRSNSKGIYSVPNRTLSDTTVVNHSKLDGLELTVPFPMSDNHNREQAVALIREVLKGASTIKPEFEVFHEWVNGCEQYNVVVKAINYNLRRKAASEVSMIVTKALYDGMFPLGSVTFIKMT